LGLFVEAPESIEEIKRINSDISAPTAANMVPGGKTPLFKAEELHRTGTAAGLEDHFLVFYEFNKLLGLMGIREKEKEYYQGIS